MKNLNFLFSEELPMTEVGPGVFRQMMGYNKEIMMVKVVFTAGSNGSLHQHSHSQSSYIAKGTFEVTIGNDVSILSAGDGFFVSPSVPHGVKCLEEGIIIDTFNPYREDFLK